MEEYRIIIVDDHPVVRSGLTQFIGHQQGLTVCAEAGNGHEALELVREHKPDVVVLDITLGQENGLELIAKIKSRAGAIPVLVLSMHDELLYAERALRAGASGYIMKDASTAEVVEAIRKILRGELYLSAEMSKRLVNRAVNHEAPVNNTAVSTLTNRELHIFELIGQGRKSSEIADSLHISIKTVEAHRANIQKKLSLQDHIELLRYASHWTQNPCGANGKATGGVPG
jgi:DNA-binding NarL/FixJ family response regulator